MGSVYPKPQQRLPQNISHSGGRDARRSGHHPPLEASPKSRRPKLCQKGPRIHPGARRGGIAALPAKQGLVPRRPARRRPAGDARRESLQQILREIENSSPVIGGAASAASAKRPMKTSQCLTGTHREECAKLSPAEHHAPHKHMPVRPVGSPPSALVSVRQTFRLPCRACVCSAAASLGCLITPGPRAALPADTAPLLGFLCTLSYQTWGRDAPFRWR